MFKRKPKQFYTQEDVDKMLQASEKRMQNIIAAHDKYLASTLQQIFGLAEKHRVTYSTEVLPLEVSEEYAYFYTTKRVDGFQHAFYKVLDKEIWSLRDQYAHKIEVLTDAANAELEKILFSRDGLLKIISAINEFQISPGVKRPD